MKGGEEALSGISGLLISFVVAKGTRSQMRRAVDDCTDLLLSRTQLNVVRTRGLLGFS